MSDLKEVIDALKKYNTSLKAFYNTPQEIIENAQNMFTSVQKQSSNILFIRNMLNEMHNTGDLNDRTPINLLDTVLEDLYGEK